MSHPSLWLIAYDIADPTRLRAVAGLCEDVGRRLQQSVFLCACDGNRIDQLQAEVLSVMDPSADHFVVIPLCQRCRTKLRQHGVDVALPTTDDPLIV